MRKRIVGCKEKISRVILLVLATCIFAVMLSGCGRRQLGSEKSPEETASSEEKSASETDTESGEGERTEEAVKTGEPEGAEIDCLTLQEELRPAIVQIYCGDYRGSGVVWEITEEEVRVISSGHLLKNGETCEILCYAGVYYEAEVDRILEDCDIGFAVFSAKDLREDGIELRAAVPSERNKEELIRGEELAVYGSMDYAAGNFVKGYLIEAESEIQFEGYDSEQPLMLCGIVRESADAVGAGAAEEAGSGKTDAAGPVDAGMSGSGVFDRQGKLLGILAGGDGESGFAAVPVWRFV